MSKAEAIVVTEPKEKFVPEFNEKEVLGIVNKGISAGQVNIPAGGTKLYKHFLYKPDYSGPNFYVISPESASLTTSDKQNALKQSIVLEGYFLKTSFDAQSPTLDDFKLIGIAFDGTISAYGGAWKNTDMNDTVTEL